MTRTRAFGLCLGVMLAISVGAAASTYAALPAFVGPMPIPFKSASKAVTLETVGKKKVKCTGSSDAGEVTGAQTGTVMIRFTGCESLKFPCSTPGVAGEVITGVLTMTLGYINRVTKEVGIDLSSPTGAPITTFICGNITGSVIGSAIGVITPTNKLLNPPKHFTLKFAQKKGKQTITNLAGEPIDVPQMSLSGPFEEAGLAMTDALSFPAPFEIKA